MSQVQVLLATDGSAEADQAEAVLKNLRLAPQSRVAVAMAATKGAEADENKIRRSLAYRIVRGVCDRLAEEGFAAEPHVLEGPPSEALLRFAQESKPDLVVVGSEARDNAKPFPLGSVAWNLLLYSGASVVVGRKPPREQDANFGQRMSAIVAIDSSPDSKLLLETLGSRPSPIFDRLYLLWVEPMSFVSADPDATASPRPTHGLALRERQALAEAGKTVERCASTVSTISDAGRPSMLLSQYADLYDVDLAIVGACRDEARIGSCAFETAVAAPCSVMVLRDRMPLGTLS